MCLTHSCFCVWSVYLCHRHTPVSVFGPCIFVTDTLLFLCLVRVSLSQTHSCFCVWSVYLCHRHTPVSVFGPCIFVTDTLLFLCLVRVSLSPTHSCFCVCSVWEIIDTDTLPFLCLFRVGVLQYLHSFVSVSGQCEFTFNAYILLFRCLVNESRPSILTTEK